jgi:molybdate transport system ATP-binding protein
MININISKKLYGGDGTIELNLELNIKENEFVAISGESGSGKTTFLRILAGLQSCDGYIKVDNQIWLDKNGSIKPQQRDIGFVFQDYALFENMSVEQNLLYVKKDKQLCEKLLHMTNMHKLKDRLPKTLSGGQKQRVSICRAMMSKPKLLLLDEPLSALDLKMRTKLQDEILTMHKEFGTTTLMVSHDPSEIYKLASRVIVIEKGCIKADGEAKDVLLKTSGSQKFSFDGEILDIIKVDVIYIAIVAIGQQLSEIVISQEEAKNLKIGSKVDVSTKAFSPIIKQRI